MRDDTFTDEDALTVIEFALSQREKLANALTPTYSEAFIDRIRSGDFHTFIPVDLKDAFAAWESSQGMVSDHVSDHLR